MEVSVCVEELLPVTVPLAGALPVSDEAVVLGGGAEATAAAELSFGEGEGGSGASPGSGAGVSRRLRVAVVP